MSGFVWPSEHPAVTDGGLQPYATSAAAICPRATSVTVLKYQPGRRVTSLLDSGDASHVVKLYATHRAHKTYGRLRAFEGTDAAGLVPAAQAMDATEHACLASFVPGTPVDELSDGSLVAACHAAGASLHRLHGCGARLARTWTIDDEIRQLRASCGPASRDGVEHVIGAIDVTPVPVVPSHRDCYPAQAVIRDGVVRWIDLDDAALAPAGLDVGNFAAHLVNQFGLPDESLAARAAIGAFLEGYGDEPRDLDSWTRLSLARLAGLAEIHGRGDMDRHLEVAHAGTVLP